MVELPSRVVVTARSFAEADAAYLLANGCEVDRVSLPPGSNDGNLSIDTLVERLEHRSQNVNRRLFDFDGFHDSL